MKKTCNPIAVTLLDRCFWRVVSALSNTKKCKNIILNFDRFQSSKNDIYNLCKKVNFHLKYDILYDFILVVFISSFMKRMKLLKWRCNFYMFYVFKNGYFYNLMIFIHFIIYFSHFDKLIITLSTNFNVKIWCLKFGYP